MKQLEVQIMGQGYLLGCPEGGEPSLLSAVAKVDAAMCKIRDAGKIKARDRIAVLAALNLAFDLDNQARTPATEPMPVAQGDASAATGSRVDTRLNELIWRLDQALGADGHLL